MKKLTKTMMLMGSAALMGAGAYMYMEKNKKMTTKIKNMYNLEK